MFDVRGLNSNETYCCKPNEVKAIFKNDKIDILFGTQISRDPIKNSVVYCLNKKNKGIAVAVIRAFRPYIVGLDGKNILSQNFLFYVKVCILRSCKVNLSRIFCRL